MKGPRHALLLTTSVALAGCVPASPVATPAPIVSADWSRDFGKIGDSDVASTSQAGLAFLLGSPELGALSKRAFAQNADLAIAQSRIAQSQALLRSARASTLPEVTLGGDVRGDRRVGGTLPDFRDASAELNVALDLDVFGKAKAQKLAASERARAARFSEKAVALAVEAELASAFIQRAALQRRIEIIDQNIDRAIELERVIKVRLAEGAATRVELGLQTIHILNLRNEQSRLVEALDQTRTALALLAGEEAPIFQFAPGRIDDLTLPALVPPAPAALLAERPDIRAAEALIAAANGDVSQARANFFPQVSLSLSGLIGDSSTGPLGKVISAGSSILAPIFARGRLRGDLEYASAYQVETVETYRRTVLQALSDVEDAQSAVLHSRERADLLEQIVDEARNTARLANLQYLEGEADLQNLLDAQQFLSDAEEAQVLASQDRFDALIALYRAMGGHDATVASDAPRLAY